MADGGSIGKLFENSLLFGMNTSLLNTAQCATCTVLLLLLFNVSEASYSFSNSFSNVL